MADTILVIGATGYLGRHIVDELHRRGHAVRALARSRPRAEMTGPFDSPALIGRVADWVIGDVTDPTTVAGICDGVDRVVSALGVTRQKADPWDIDFRGNLAVLREAEEAGVRSFLYTGVLHADRGTSATMRAKSGFLEVLQRSPVPAQIVNPSGYFSDLSDLVAMARLGVSVHLGDGATRLNPIHGADLARFIANHLTDAPGWWDVGGPDIHTYRDLESLAFAAFRKRPRTLGLPPWITQSTRWVADRVSPRAGNLVRFFSEGLLIDAVGSPTGTHHIADYFQDLADSHPKQPAG